MGGLWTTWQRTEWKRNEKGGKGEKKTEKGGKEVETGKSGKEVERVGQQTGR